MNEGTRLLQRAIRNPLPGGRLVWPVLLSLVALSMSAALAAQEKDTRTQRRSLKADVITAPTATRAPDCIRCHTCERPTPENKCLPNCTRNDAAELSSLPASQLPDVIVLDALENAYLPVPFDHQGHSEMAEMAEGCDVCHHHTPEGQPPPACVSCHGIDEAEADIDKPALLGAYHQQCLNCHREWINERDCEVCHQAKAGRARIRTSGGPPTKDDVLTQMHPPIPEPDGDVYPSRVPEITETQVIFRHREHAHRYGLRCVECHRESSCARCHASERPAEQPRTVAEHHAPCIRCHRQDMNLAARAEDRCQRCHWKEGQPKPESFDHASTGWALSGYHQDRSCRECHVHVPFVKLDRDCSRCHSDWSPATFDHQVTGQILDENHAEQDCDACHVERRFDRPPTCDDCHEKDEGISFPAKRPGPLTGGEAALPEVREPDPGGE